jgi:hypothetical protein
LQEWLPQAFAESLVNLGLQSIQQDLRADMAGLQWVIDLYNLTYAVFILTGVTSMGAGACSCSA